MAKKWYFGVNNVAKKASKLYFGVDGVARKVSKIYIGENGVAKLCYESKKPDEEIPITSSRTWTVPADAKTIDIFAVGGGGGAGGSFYKYTETGIPWENGTQTTTEVYGPSGGSGHTATVTGISVVAGEELSVVIGAGGTGGKSYNSGGGGDVSSESSMTAGGNGGESYVTRGGTRLITASGGAGGRKANITSSSSGYYNGTVGADGGSGSGAGGAYMENFRFSGGDVTQNIIYAYCMHDDSYAATGSPYGSDGSDGSNGGYVDKWFVRYQPTPYVEQQQGRNAYRGGYGQGSTTRKFGQSGATLYANVGTVVSPNTGNSGKMGLAPTSMASSKAGSSGIVIIRVHY